MQPGTSPQILGRSCCIKEYNDTRRCSKSGLPARLIDGCAGVYAARLGVEAGEFQSGKSTWFVEALQRGRWPRCSPGWLCGVPARRSSCPGVLGKCRRCRLWRWTRVPTVPRSALPGIPGSSFLWSFKRHRQWKGTGGMALPDSLGRDRHLRLGINFCRCVFRPFRPGRSTTPGLLRVYWLHYQADEAGQRERFSFPVQSGLFTGPAGLKSRHRIVPPPPLYRTPEGEPRVQSDIFDFSLAACNGSGMRIISIYSDNRPDALTRGCLLLAAALP